MPMRHLYSSIYRLSILTIFFLSPANVPVRIDFFSKHFQLDFRQWQCFGYFWRKEQLEPAIVLHIRYLVAWTVLSLS